MMIVRRIVLMALLVVSGVRAAELSGPELEALLTEAEVSLAGVDNYTAVFHKQERVEGKLLAAERMQLKFRKPFSVYLKWLKGPHQGRETLYVEGANENRLKAHEGGILNVVTVNVDPNGSRAMKGNRHPITDTGLAKLTQLVKTNVHRGVVQGEIQARDHGEETVYGRKTRKVEGTFPKEKADQYYCLRAVVNLDRELKVPIRVQIFDREDRMIETYGYEDLKLNAGLTDLDFDPENPAYGF